MQSSVSLKKNIAANLVAQLYVAAIGVLVLPLYIRFIGAEAYGLVGIFTLLQAWLNMLDMGLSPTVARETARFRGGGLDVLSYRRLLRAMQLIFLVLGALAALVLWCSAEWISTQWLKPIELTPAQVLLSLQLIALGVALRWVSGFYRSCISGSERLVWLGGFNASIATLRFVGVLPLIAWVDASPTAFFAYQLLVALVELGILVGMAKMLAPSVAAGQPIGWSLGSLFAPVKSLLKLSMAFSFTSVAWIFVMQVDKLVLSRTLPLGEYGHFALAVLVASGILTMVNPISAALLPRLARLQAERKTEEMTRLYRQATQLVTAVAIPTALIVALYAREILWVWTGSEEVAAASREVLSLYALGNAMLVLGAFPYYLQFANGNLKLHVIGNALFVAILVPAVVVAAARAGATGVAMAWVACHALYFVAWAPVVHGKFLAGKHLAWVSRDILRVSWPSLCLVTLAALALPRPTHKEAAVALVAVLFVACAASALHQAGAARLLRGRYPARA